MIFLIIAISVFSYLGIGITTATLRLPQLWEQENKAEYKLIGNNELLFNNDFVARNVKKAFIAESVLYPVTAVKRMSQSTSDKFTHFVEKFDPQSSEKDSRKRQLKIEQLEKSCGLESVEDSEEENTEDTLDQLLEKTELELEDNPTKDDYFYSDPEEYDVVLEAFNELTDEIVKCYCSLPSSFLKNVSVQDVTETLQTIQNGVNLFELATTDKTLYVVIDTSDNYDPIYSITSSPSKADVLLDKFIKYNSLDNWRLNAIDEIDDFLT